MIPESFSAIPGLSIWEKLLLFVEVAAVLAIVALILYYLLWRSSDAEDESKGDKGKDRDRPHG